MRPTRAPHAARIRLVAAAAAVVAGLFVPAAAQAQVELLTPDTPSPPTQYTPPMYEGASADGSTMFFSSAEPVTGEPNGPSGALFARSNGVTRRITRGADSPDEVQPDFAGSSGDGSTAYFYLPNFINSYTWTNVLDRWRGGDVETISDGAGFVCADATGSQVVFLSYRALTPDDHDSRGDLYALSSSGLRLLTPGASEAGGAADVGPWGHTPDCARVFFNTWEPLAAADGDTSFDVYSVDVGSGAVRLDSTGPAAAEGQTAGYAGSSADGTHVYFTVDGKLYDHAGNVTRLVTSAADAAFKGASADGSHVFFETDQQLSPADKDAQTDVYDTTIGGTQLVSTGHSPTASYAVFAGASADGSHVIFSTAARVEPDDMDSDRDLYDRHAGSTTLISGGAQSDLNDRPELYAISPTGDRIVFGSARPLTPDDTDTSDDIYVSSNRSLRRLSTGPAGGNGDANSAFLGASADASRIFFQTAEGLVPADTDGQSDIYSAEVPTLAPPPDDPTGNPPGGGNGDGGNGDGGDGNGGTQPPPTAPRCVVPAVKNLTLATAKRRLAAHHCRLGTVHLRASARRVAARKRRVAGQSPRAGAVRKQGARVSVWLAARSPL